MIDLLSPVPTSSYPARISPSVENGILYAALAAILYLCTLGLLSCFGQPAWFIVLPPTLGN